MNDKRTILITGGAGFIGVNSAEKFIKKGWTVIIYDNLLRRGTPLNLDFLNQHYPGKFQFIRGDIRDKNQRDLNAAIAQSDVVLHLAGQVAVTTSITDPRTDFEINALGTFNILEAVRLHGQNPLVIFSSSNKVYGALENVPVEEKALRYVLPTLPQGVAESQLLDFHSPYGASKGSADQYVRDYSRIYGVPTVVFRQSCIYGPHQFGVEDQGWVAWFIIAAILGKPITIYGNGKQVRDLLYIDDLTSLYEMAAGKKDAVSGKIYNIGGGAVNTLSLLEFFQILDQQLSRKVSYGFAPIRPGDQPIYISDIGKIKADIGWEPRVAPDQGIAKLLEWVRTNQERIKSL